jgi:starch phosphorylase
MFHGLWPSFDTSEVPVTSVTNGVHHLTWIHRELLDLLEAPTGSLSETDGYDWNALAEVDSKTIWALKRKMREDLIAMTRARLAASSANRGMSMDWVAKTLNPDVVTFGFARRVPSYKRLTLMLRDPARLKALLTDPEQPIQIVIAGKAHPADEGGKALIQQLAQFADDPAVRERIVFLPDYDMAMAKRLYPGCDVWMNNPLRPYEACGTSGMKAALNGAANLSIRDGWWDEWFDPAYGWEIPSAEGVDGADRRDDLEANHRWVGPKGRRVADGSRVRDEPLHRRIGLQHRARLLDRWSRVTRQLEAQDSRGVASGGGRARGIARW